MQQIYQTQTQVARANNNDNNSTTQVVRRRARLISLVVMTAVASTLIQLTGALKLSSVHIPALVQRGTNFWLACQFELEPGEQLYSVKWYKDNQEFYRLQAAEHLQPPMQVQANSNTDGQQQQQYFSQSGLNVMMSWSNATHVRLLNASIASEGNFACEISTQNLSTIRYEREIKVYVLAHTRPNVIGFRSRYALGDRVDLQCSSDFSRPKAALGWFINGKQVTQSNEWFELEHRYQSKPGDPSLLKSNLGLKFKLSLELLRLLSSASNSSDSPASSVMGDNEMRRLGSRLTDRPANQRNQSRLVASQWQPETKTEMDQEIEDEIGKGPLMASIGSRRAATTGNRQLPYQLQASQSIKPEPLRLQCKYKLTEVSDVTFSELLLRPAVANPLADGPSAAPGTPRRPAKDGERGRPVGRHVSGRRWTEAEADVRLINGASLVKAADNRLLQTPSPAPLAILRRALLDGGDQAAATCQSGALAMQPDDPVLISTEVGAAETESDDQQDEATEQEFAGGWFVGQTISVNCSTISALFAGPTGVPKGAYSTVREPLRAGGVAFCNNGTLRRRLTISGRSQGPTGSSNEDVDYNRRLSGESNWRRLSVSGKDRRPVMLAYLSLSPVSQSATSTSTLTTSSSTPTLTAATTFNLHQRSDNVEFAEFSPTSQQLANTAATAADSSLAGSGDLWSAPPLLEWFINNQEAPTNTDGASEPATLYNSQSANIDYTQYFANFDAKSIQQNMPLSLTLNKRHFMTPDSNLRLRCSSTQAQVLASDSISLLIVPLAPGEQAPQQGMAHHYQTRRPHQARSSTGQLASRSSSSSDPMYLGLFHSLTAAAATLISALVCTNLLK